MRIAIRSRPLTSVRQRVEPWWDIVRRVWSQSAEDNVPFLAGGLAFNILLALVPFVLLLVAGLSFLLGNETYEAASTVTALLARLLPSDAPMISGLVRDVVSDVVQTRGAVTLYSAVSFAWFSTRLFGSLRSTLALVFDTGDRSIVVGKVFDFAATLITTLAVVVYVVFSAYLDLATTRGLGLLREVGLRESAMSGLGYLLGRLLAVTLVFLLFYALYRGLPRKRPAVRVAFVGAATAAVLFEIARHVFSLVIRTSSPGSLYTGTIAAIVVVVFWTYYGALLFLIGGETAQAYDLRCQEIEALESAEANRKASRTPPTPSRKVRGS
ncbi:MAG: YihY/virulence factor BrkB family protein [Gemmatimonadaceae bacterium]|nr:YihY/virulence factor BrkB family protein [Gemmatimonadaceae bacterium]